MRPYTRLLACATAVAVVAVLTASTAQLQNRSSVLTLAAGGLSSLSELREADSLVDRLGRDRVLRLAASEDDPLVPGRTHARFRQYHDGVPIFGAEVTRQTARGVTVSLFGTLHLGIDVETTPALSTDDATRIIERLGNVHPGGSTPPRLVVLPDREGTGVYRLVYEARAFTGTRLMAYFIDASTGDLVWAYDDLKTQQPALPCERCAVGDGLGVKGDRKKISVTAVGGTFLAQDQLRPADVFTFDMRGDLLHTLDVLDGTVQLFDADLANDTDNRWLDGASVDAHVGMGWTYDYLYHRFGRQGLNGTNVRMISLVHPVDRADIVTAPADILGLFYLNAFYCGTCGPDGVGLAVFGEGLPPNVPFLGQRWNFLSGALDIVAHELAHAVTDFTSALLYMDESGALNEAFSDVIGVGTEYYAEPFYRDGAGVADYLLGEDVIEPGGIRSLADPQRFGDPDHYSLLFVGMEDNGGVHTNSLIPGHAYYLAIEGGTNRVSGLTVSGVGAANREQMEKVFYRAFTVLMTRDADFAEARAATIQSARDLYGAGSAAEQAVTQAWTAVGVN
ncbi:MAG: peptidase M4 family protein [Acidobacteria bacterium]|nr:peptidase M4 family protein [Acidobacteriota bacterium]